MATDPPPGPALTPDQRRQVDAAAGRLAGEFRGAFPAGAVERHVAETLSGMGGRARDAARLPALVEHATRDRLRALARLQAEPARPAVLFLCVHNAGRSQMAAGWLRHLAGDAVEVFSGGSDPAASLNPAAVAAMAEAGIDISSEVPTPWAGEVARTADVVVTMGCGDSCPIYPGTRYEDWDITDPAGRPLDVVRRARDEIEQRVRTLMAGLDVPERA